MSETLSTNASIQSGHWAIICADKNRRQLALTLPEAESIRKFWKAKYPDCRVTVRPLTEAAMAEMYRLNGWPRPPVSQEPQ